MDEEYVNELGGVGGEAGHCPFPAKRMACHGCAVAGRSMDSLPHAPPSLLRTSGRSGLGCAGQGGACMAQTNVCSEE